MSKTTHGYLIKRGKTWYAVWECDKRKYCVTTKTTSRKDALPILKDLILPFEARNRIAMLKEALDNAKAMQGINPSRTITPQSAWEMFVRNNPSLTTQKNSLAVYESKWSNFVKWCADNGIKSLSDITQVKANEYASSLSTLSPGTFNLYVSLLRSVYSTLKLADNPWMTVKRRKNDVQGRRALTLVEIQNVLEKASGELLGAILAGLYTGLRMKDVCYLKMDDYDPKLGVLTVKTSKRNKLVLIPVHPSLKAWIESEPRNGNLFPDLADEYGTRRTRVIRRFASLFQSCGIVTSENRKQGQRKASIVGFHSLRHTFISMCRNNNAPLSVVESMVGHSTADMTRHYTHVGHDAAKAAVDSLPSFEIGKAKDSKVK